MPKIAFTTPRSTLHEGDWVGICHMWQIWHLQIPTIEISYHEHLIRVDSITGLSISLFCSWKFRRIPEPSIRLGTHSIYERLHYYSVHHNQSKITVLRSQSSQAHGSEFHGKKFGLNQAQWSHKTPLCNYNSVYKSEISNSPYNHRSFWSHPLALGAFGKKGTEYGKNAYHPFVPCARIFLLLSTIFWRWISRYTLNRQALRETNQSYVLDRTSSRRVLWLQARPFLRIIAV